VTTTPTTWKSLFQVNATDGGNQGDLQIVDIGLGRYVAVWTESSGDLIGTANGDDLVGQIFDAEGNPIGAEFQVNQGYFADDEHNAALASRPGGGFVVVYEDTDGVGTSIRVQVYDVDGNVVGGAPLTIAEDVGTDGLYNPSVAVQADGSFLVTYEFDHNELGTDVDIVGRIVDDTGTVGGQFDIYNFTDAASPTPRSVRTWLPLPTATTSSCSRTNRLETRRIGIRSSESSIRPVPWWTAT
jgi:hypothetical protein